MSRSALPACAALLVAATLAAQPGGEKVLFEEKFAATPGKGWAWLKRNDKAWRVRGGALELRVLPGQENVLAYAVPAPSEARPYAVEVTVTGSPQPAGQFGLVWYAGEKQGPKLVREVIDGKAYVSPGKRELANATVQFRYLVEGRRFTAQYRPGGRGPYRTAFSGGVPAAKRGELRVALAAFNGPADGDHWARFSDFRVVALPPREPDLTTKAAESDPDFRVQGEYLGEVAARGKYGAQVVAKGDGKFEVYLLAGGLPGAGWDGKTRLKAAAVTKDGVASLAGGKWAGSFQDGKFTGKTEAGDAFVLARVERKSPTLGAKPPPGAVVLFDGTTAEGWTDGRLVGGNLLYRGTSSRMPFATGKLHLEFRTSYEPKRSGQGRGNSGVRILGREIQVLDSFGLEGKDNECGAFYGSRAPAVNMCLPPLAWQTYDVEVRPNDAGDLRATVWHNGVKVHEDYPLARKGAKPIGINLQDHGNPVVYRNIWIVPAGEPGEKK